MVMPPSTDTWAPVMYDVGIGGQEGDHLGDLLGRLPMRRSGVVLIMAVGHLRRVRPEHRGVDDAGMYRTVDRDAVAGQSGQRGAEAVIVPATVDFWRRSRRRYLVARTLGAAGDVPSSRRPPLQIAPSLHGCRGTRRAGYTENRRSSVGDGVLGDRWAPKAIPASDAACRGGRKRSLAKWIAEGDNLLLAGDVVAGRRRSRSPSCRPAPALVVEDVGHDDPWPPRRRACTSASPCPLAPPVISATLPSSRPTDALLLVHDRRFVASAA